MTSLSRSFVLLVAIPFLTGPALAHAHLKSATPADGATVTAAPSELDLTFSEGLNLKFSGVKVTGSGGKAIATGESSLKAGGDTTLVVPLTDPLGSGVYTVNWHALSTDGHKTTGSYRFSVKP